MSREPKVRTRRKETEPTVRFAPTTIRGDLAKRFAEELAQEIQRHGTYGAKSVLLRRCLEEGLSVLGRKGKKR